MAQNEAQGAAYAVVDSGYDYDYVDPPPDRLVCKICHFPCFKAQLSECRGARDSLTILYRVFEIC